MDAVFGAAGAAGWPAAALHREYVSLPEAPPRENLPFTLRLLYSGRTLAVPGERSATEVLDAAGVKVDVTCSDGLCGVCALGYDAEASDEIDHRDVVLGAAERRERVVLCCSRARHAGGEIALRL